jgi:hypothetical protein
MKDGNYTKLASLVKKELLSDVEANKLERLVQRK